MEALLRTKLDGITPEMFRARGDAVANDTAALQAAIDFASASKIGVVVLSRRYLCDTLTLPRNVWLRGSGAVPLQPYATISPYDYPSQIRLRAGATIVMGQSSGLRDLLIIRDGLTLPVADNAAAIAIKATFGGTAVTGTGIYFQVIGCGIFGFAQAINCNATASQGGCSLWNTHIDCTAGVLMTGGGFNCTWSDLVCWPYLTAAVCTAGSLGLHRAGSAYKLVSAGGAGNDWSALINPFSYGYAKGIELDGCSAIDLIAPKCDYGAGFTGTEIGIDIYGAINGRINVDSPKIITVPTSIRVNLTSPSSSGHVRISSMDLVPNGTGLNVISGTVVAQGGTITNSAKGIEIGAGAEDFAIDGIYFDTLTVGLEVHASWAGIGKASNLVFRGVGTEISAADAVLDQIQFTGLDDATAPIVNTMPNARIQNTNAVLQFRALGAGANARLWDIAADTSGQLLFRALTDAGAPTPFMTVFRTAGTPTLVRTNIALDVTSELFINATRAVGPRVLGYTNAPTGTLNRATALNGSWTQAVAATYSQAEVTALRDQIIVLTQRLAALDTDLRAHGLIGA